MDKIINFLYVFFNGDFFIVIIVALILILLVVLVGLIKTQKENDRLVEESNALKENAIKEINNTEIQEQKEEIFEIDDINKSIEEKIDDSILEEKALETFDESSPIIEEALNPIEAYELDEEANAVISTKELESIESERNKLYGTENNAKLIEEYETEQENKAIISYSELLKNAKGIELEFIEKPKEDEDAPVVKQVEIKDQPLKGVNYTAEEEYLRILKEFRDELMLNG